MHVLLHQDRTSTDLFPLPLSQLSETLPPGYRPHLFFKVDTSITGPSPNVHVQPGSTYLEWAEMATIHVSPSLSQSRHHQPIQHRAQADSTHRWQVTDSRSRSFYLQGQATMEANPAAWASHNVKRVNGGHGYCLCRPTKCRGSTAFATPVDALGSPPLPWQGVVSTRPRSPSHR